MIELNKELLELNLESDLSVALNIMRRQRVMVGYLDNNDEKIDLYKEKLDETAQLVCELNIMMSELVNDEHI